MSDEAIGVIPRECSKQSHIHECSSGFRLFSEGGHIPSPDYTRIGADELSSLLDKLLDHILEEIDKPRYAFERTFDGHRYTRKIR